MSPKTVARRSWDSFNDDNLLSRAAELGYYFLFALFPTLLSASAIFGLVMRSQNLYLKLLNYLALVVPHDAFKIVLDTFKQTTMAASAASSPLGWLRVCGRPPLGSARFRIRSTLCTR